MVTFSRLMVTTNTHGSATLVRLNVSFVEPALMTDDPRLNKRAIFKNTKLLNLELLFLSSASPKKTAREFKNGFNSIKRIKRRDMIECNCMSLECCSGNYRSSNLCINLR